MSHADRCNLRRRRAAFGALSLLLCLVMVLSTRTAGAAPGEDDDPIGNPDLVASCGIDIQVTLDASTSIANSGSTNDVKKAFRAFTSALDNTGSRLAVSQFASVGTLPIGSTYTTVTDATIASTFEPYIDQFEPDGSTNWEDGLRVDRYFLPRPSQATPHLVVFITDGDPNKIVKGGSSVTYDPGNPSVGQNEYELKVPLSDDEVSGADDDDARDNAVPNANALKAAGSHVLVVAVGSGLSSSSSLDRIVDISGPDVFSGSGTFDITTDDVYKEPDFSKLEDALRDAAFQLCSPSVNVRKLVDVNPDPAVDDLQPGIGWSMTATASPTPAAWVLPVGASGASATTTTGPDGFANFQWSTPTPVDSSVSVTEVVQAGFVNDPAATTCTYRTPDQPTDTPLPGFSATAGGFSGTAPADSIVTCTMVNRVPPAPAVTIQKFTNGADANTVPGPFVHIGDPVAWTYVVTNTGNTPLSAIAVTDDRGVTVNCPATTLGTGEEMTCTAAGTAASGQYANVGTVNAVGAGTPVTANDPSHYFGVDPGIDIEKSTNGADADSAPGPLVAVGSAVNWSYVVTNNGTVPLTSITVTDDQPGVTVTCPVTPVLAPAASITCTATGTAQAGPYGNVGTVTALTPGLVQVGDSDPSHYFGMNAAVTVAKSTNLDPADTAPGPALEVGSPVTWIYRVTNTGNVPLVSWHPTDSVPGVTVQCQQIPVLLPTKVGLCYAQGTVQAGQYTNTATVDAINLLAPLGAHVTATNDANYFGEQGGIALVKTTNGEDANRPPGPFIPNGDPVSWVYHVTNTGNTTLSNIQVVDLRGVGLTCPGTTLAAGASMDCTASDIAHLGQYFNLAFARGETPSGKVVRAIDPSHYFGAVPGIHIETLTDDVDADTGRGPFIAVGAPVVWTYVVWNTGNVTVNGIAVTDSRGVPVTCPLATLAPTEQMVCIAIRPSTEGQYENIGSVTAVDTNGVALSDADPTHHFGFRSAIDVENHTNGVDADTGPGPSLEVGAPVTWTYLVTNPGNVALARIALVDNQGVSPSYVGGDANGNALLDPTETFTFRATGTAVAGQYENIATVTALDPLETAVQDSDPSHYIAATTTAPPPTVTPPPPTPTTTVPPGTSTVRIVKRWVRGRGVTRIFVDRNGRLPYDAAVRADSTGDTTRLVVPVSTAVSVGEALVPKGYTATINCGGGRRAYRGGPFRVTSPATAGATRLCTVVNTGPPPPPPAMLAVFKSANRRTISSGQTVGFTIRVRNVGRGTATKVDVCDRLPDGLVFTRAPGAHFVSGDACWRIARLGVGQQRRFVVRVRLSADQRKVFVNVVTVDGATAACATRAGLSARKLGKVGATCRASAVLAAVASRRAGRAGGVTG
jgi:uncharacterized repeat protein (TIGR01451 family)